MNERPSTAGNPTIQTQSVTLYTPSADTNHFVTIPRAAPAMIRTRSSGNKVGMHSK